MMTEQLKTELLPCPFCGGEAKAHIGEYSFSDVQIKCHTCDSESGLFNEHGDHKEAKDKNMAEAIAAWNRRAPVERQATEGWKLVPIQPTPEMVKAAQFHTEHDDDEERGDPKNYRAKGQALAVWHEMLSAAPSAPGQAAPAGGETEKTK